MKQGIRLAAIVAACVWGSVSSGAAAGPARAVVVTESAVKITNPYALKYPGKIEPVKAVAIIPRVTGIIEKQCFKEGALVKKGELLFVLEDTTYRAKIDTVKGEITQIKAALRYAEVNFHRQNTLSESKATAQVSLDFAREEFNAAQGKLKAAEAALRDAENTLSYTRIYAPITGKIGKCALTPGNLVTPSTGTLVKITGISPIYVVFSLSENIFRAQFGGMKGFVRNADIRVELADHTVEPESARVAIIDPTVDESSDTIKIWGEFSNKNEQLLSGSYVTVLLRRKHFDQFVGILPSALQVDKKGSFVYVMKPDGTAERRYIVPGSVNGDLLEVEHGLRAKEIVVVDGMHKIRPGVPVRTVPYRK